MSAAPVKPASKRQPGADPYSIPLAKIDVSDAELFETDTLWGYFERLRKEDPVDYWSPRVSSAPIGLSRSSTTSCTWRSTRRSSPPRPRS